VNILANARVWRLRFKYSQEPQSPLLMRGFETSEHCLRSFNSFRDATQQFADVNAATAAGYQRGVRGLENKVTCEGK